MKDLKSTITSDYKLTDSNNELKRKREPTNTSERSKKDNSRKLSEVKIQKENPKKESAPKDDKIDIKSKKKTKDVINVQSDETGDQNDIDDNHASEMKRLKEKFSKKLGKKSSHEIKRKQSTESNRSNSKLTKIQEISQK